MKVTVNPVFRISDGKRIAHEGQFEHKGPVMQFGGSGSPDWDKVVLKYEDVKVQIVDGAVRVTVGDNPPVLISRPDGKVH